MPKRVALSGILVALAFVFGYIEFLLPLPIGIPGMKLGLANLVVLLTLYSLNPQMAAVVSLVRILLAGFTFGSPYGMLYSLAGGVLSFLIMWLCHRNEKLGPVGVSMLGGIAHNIGQVLVAFAFLGISGVLYYVFPLLIAGALTGFIIGVVTKLLLPTLQKIVRK